VAGEADSLVSDIQDGLMSDLNQWALELVAEAFFRLRTRMRSAGVEVPNVPLRVEVPCRYGVVRVELVATDERPPPPSEND
jgi:hypothetical protein